MTDVTTTAPPTVTPVTSPKTTTDVNVIIGLLKALTGVLTSVDLTSADWWASALGEVVAIVAFILGLFHPGFHLPAVVQAVLPSVSVIAVALVAVFRRNANASEHNARLDAAVQLQLSQSAIDHDSNRLQMQIALRQAELELERFKADTAKAQIAAQERAQKRADKAKKATAQPASAPAASTAGAK